MSIFANGIQHLDSFCNSNCNIRVWPSRYLFNKSLQIVFILRCADLQRSLLSNHLIGIGHNTYLIALHRRHINEHFHSFISYLIRVTCIHRGACIYG
ncbi:hypothetical protein D3C73_663510 [compost metagenome]